MKVYICLIILILFSFTGCGNSSTSYNAPNPVPAGTITINIAPGSIGKGPAAFGANPLHIPQGSIVVWQNSDSMPHTATSNSGVFDTGTISPGTVSKSVTFTSTGSFPYFCQIHGAQSMSGMIMVP